MVDDMKRLIAHRDEVSRWNEVAKEADDARKRRNRRETLKSFGLVSAIALIPSGWIAREFAPRVQQVVEFIPVEGGVPVNYHKIAELPAEAQGDLAVVTAWQYVLRRERFSQGTADQDYKIVSLMSDERTRREYQYENTTANKTSPWARYAEKNIVVSIEKVSDADLPPPQGYSGPPPGYSFDYWRVETSPMGVLKRELMKASLRFHRNVPGVTARHRREFNAPGLIVWEYPKPQQIG